MFVVFNMRTFFAVSSFPESFERKPYLYFSKRATWSHIVCLFSLQSSYFCHYYNYYLFPRKKIRSMVNVCRNNNKIIYTQRSRYIPEHTPHVFLEKPDVVYE